MPYIAITLGLVVVVFVVSLNVYLIRSVACRCIPEFPFTTFELFLMWITIVIAGMIATWWNYK